MSFTSNIKPIFFFKTPDLTNCCKIVAGITPRPDSNYVHMVSSCRKIIWSEPNVLAKPNGSNSSNFSVTIIVQRDLRNTRPFKSSLKKCQLDVYSENDDIPDADFQCALKYTILTKMSPKWCSVENYLIGGEDFLIKSGPVDAIRSFELLVAKERSHITFEGVTLNWPQFEKIAFGIYAGKDVDGYTLPTLKRCAIHSVTPVLPQWGPITTYEEMKEFWKNMYGYKLPEAPGVDLAYVTVNFTTSSNQFNYPKWAILPHQPTVIARVDPFPIIGKFLRDFHSCAASILGQPLKFLQSKASFSATQIQSLASLEESKDFQKAGLTHAIAAPAFPFKDLANYKQEVPSSSATAEMAAPLKMEIDVLPDIPESQPEQETNQKYIPIFNARKVTPLMVKKENKKVAATSVLSPETLEHICNVEIKVNEDVVNASQRKSVAQVDIGELARTHTLHKANVQQLLAYLRANNVPCKSKDKKPTLIAAVQTFMQTQED